MEGEGMVAVVRGLRDAGLAVTLMDAGRQYTLVPDMGMISFSIKKFNFFKYFLTHCSSMLAVMS